MPSNPNIRDLLQNSFLRYSKISDDPINIKREPEHESHEGEPLKKKKRVDPVDIEHSLSETVLENGIVQRKKKKKLKEKSKENNNMVYEDTNENVFKESRVKKKKKKKLQVLENEWDVSSIANVSDLNTIVANEEDNSKTSQIIEPRKVKKKKKKNKERDTSPDLNTIVANEEDNPKTSQIVESRKVKNKKKKNKEGDTSPDLNTIVAKEEDNPKTSQIVESRKVKKKKKKNKERDTSPNIEDSDFGVPKRREKTAHFGINTQNYSTGSQSSKKKTNHAEDFRSRFKSVEFIFDSENEDEETSVKEKQIANMVEIKIEAEETKPDLNPPIQQHEEIKSEGVKKRLVNRYYKPDYFNSDEDYTISMAVKKESIEELNDSTGQIKAAINWILSQNIKVSPLNMTHKRNYYIFPKSNIVEDTGTPLGFFTEVEDEEILQRIQFLEKNGVITSAKGLCNELKEDSKIHKHTKRIIGLYLCQNLTNRLAFYTTERMLKLMDKLTATPKKAKVVTDRIPWTIDDDKIIVKAVLFEIGSQSYVRVESVNDKLIAWDDIVAQFPEGQRSRSQIKERWKRVLKVRLLEAEMDPAETWTYRRELLEHIIKLGVTDRRAIRWKQVALHFPSKTSAALNQDFWNLIRHTLSPDVDLQTSLEKAYQRLNRQQSKNIQECKILRKEENKSELLDFYNSLI